jgi:hypothetical protein
MNALESRPRAAFDEEAAPSEESGAGGAGSTAEEVLADKNAQSALPTAGGRSSAASRLPTGRQNTYYAATANRQERKESLDISPDATANSSKSSSAKSHDRDASQTRQSNQQDSAQAANIGTPLLTPTTQIPVSPAPLQFSVPPQAIRAALASESGAPLAVSSSKQLSEWTAGSGLEAMTAAASGTPAAGIRGSRAPAAKSATPLHATASSVASAAAQSGAAHSTGSNTEVDITEPAASEPMIPAFFQEASPASIHHEAITEHPARHSVAISGAESAPSRTLTDNAVPSTATVAAVADSAQANAEAGSKQIPERIATRSASRESNAASPAVTLMVDAGASVALRTPVLAHTSTVQLPAQPSADAASSATGSGRDTFSALDSASSPGTPSWTHAGGQHAEAGFQDPTLGWVGVRADLSTGGVHATLLPSSADAAQTLSGHLAGLSTHLVEQNASVASLSMASPGVSGAESGSGQQMQQNPEGSQQGRASEPAQPSSHASSTERSGASVSASPAEGGVPEPLTYTGALRGTRISVMA